MAACLSRLESLTSMRCRTISLNQKLEFLTAKEKSMGKQIRRIGLAILRQKYFWTILFFVAWVGFFDDNSYYHRYELDAQNEALRADIRQYEERYNSDTRELNDLQRNPEAVERVARVNLLMKTADEDVYVIE